MGFDPLDINAQRGFFSQIFPLGKYVVCANFEENRRGPPYTKKSSSRYGVFPIENF